MTPLIPPPGVAVVLLLAGGLRADKPGPPQRPPGGPRATPVSEKHYRVYDAKGTPATLEAVLQRAQAVDVVFFGESHDDPVAHHLELLLLRRSQGTRAKQPGPLPPRPLALSLEMFERDVQCVVDEYLAGLITETHFLAGSRPWNNYQKDYRPLVEYARTQGLPVLASNAPRRYVNRVARLGADSLRDVPDPQKRGLPPLPYGPASPAYAARFNALMKKGHRPDPKKAGKEPPPAEATPPKMPPADAPPKGKHDTGRGLEAQSLWDATMAYSVAEFLLRSPRAQVLHVNGSFHSEKRMGVPEHLLRYRPGTSLLVVTVRSHKAFPKFDVADMTDRGDFVIVTDPSLPRSYTSGPPKK